MKASLTVRFFAWLRGGRVVYLKDCWGKLYVSIAVQDPFGELTAPVYWFWRVGHVVLREDGRICPRSESTYVREWKYA